MATVAKLCCIIFLFSFVRTVFSDNCNTKGPCTCVFANGTGIDLTSSAGPTFLTAQQYSVKRNGTQFELSTYHYHPCTDLIPPLDPPNGNGTCGNPLSLCRLRSTMDKLSNKATDNNYNFTQGIYEYLGSQVHSTFNADGHSITYSNPPSATIVLLVCAETADKLEIYSLEDPKNIVLAFYSRNACLKQIEELGRSIGSTLLIIFFSFVIFYLVLGVCTKKFLMGATGLEVIPNLSFWMDLPNLVKDGWAYTRNGFKLPPRSAGATTTPDPNSYDSI